MDKQLLAVAVEVGRIMVSYQQTPRCMWLCLCAICALNQAGMNGSNQA